MDTDPSAAPNPDLAATPVNRPDPQPRPPQDGIGLCLSGGGYRAMLFHVGTLWRLYDSGWLNRIDRISSVSGGSITSAVLALAWPKLSFNPADPADFMAQVVTPIRKLAGRTIDIGPIFWGSLLPGGVASRIARAYRKHLFGRATLQALPDQPRFVINATNMQSAALWRFSKPYMGDWRVGRVLNPRVELADAVAASSAFPPFLSPFTLDLDPKSFLADPTAGLQHEPYTRRAILSDGGVYDNLGLETVWKHYRTVLVSDAGMKISPEAAPWRDWILATKRMADIIDSQVRSLRNRQLMASYQEPTSSPNHRKGAYWSIRTNIQAYAAPNTLDCPFDRTQLLAATPTRLAKLDRGAQERLINWGYAVCDAAIRTHFDPSIPAPAQFPYPSGV